MRLFFAYDIDGETKNFLIKQSKDYKKKFNGIKWVIPENMHLTVKFLGEYEYPENIINSINILLKNKRIKKIENKLILNKISGFPSPFNARVIVAILHDDPILINNYYEIEKAMEQLGFKREYRKFIPHITLGRSKTPLKIIEKEFENYSVDPGSLTLYQSILKKEGPVYKIITKF